MDTDRLLEQPISRSYASKIAKNNIKNGLKNYDNNINLLKEIFSKK